MLTVLKSVVVDGREVLPLCIPLRLNFCLMIAVVAVYAIFFWGQQKIAAAAFAIVTPMAWGLVHEGIHGRLSARPAANRTLSRLLCVLLGFSFDVVQFGHLTHHRYSGFELDRPERINLSQPAWVSWLRHYVHLLGGHYVFTCMVSALAFAPENVRAFLLGRGHIGDDADTKAIGNAAVKWFSRSERIARVRVDCLMAFATFIWSLGQFQREWTVLLAALYGRALVYSMLDNLPRYGTKERGSESARNLRLPGWASWLVLNHNLHRAHHERPQIPWRGLKADVFEGSYVIAGLRQLRGPV